MLRLGEANTDSSLRCNDRDAQQDSEQLGVYGRWLGAWKDEYAMACEHCWPNAVLYVRVRSRAEQGAHRRLPERAIGQIQRELSHGVGSCLGINWRCLKEKGQENS